MLWLLILMGCDDNKQANIIKSNNLILARQPLPAFNPDLPLKQLILYEFDIPVVSTERSHETHRTITINYDHNGAITDTTSTLNLDNEDLYHSTIKKIDNFWTYTEYVLDDDSDLLVPGYIFTC